MRARTTTATVLATAGVLLVAGCSTGGTPAPGPSASSAASGTAPAPTVVTTGLEAPWSVAFDGATALVSERDSARVLEIAADGSTREVGVVPGVQSRGEGGLLGLVVDDQRRLYAYSTGADGNRIQRFALVGEAGALSLGEPETVVDGIASASYHNGGRIAFGPDGMLYAGVGDAGRSSSAQDLGSMPGKILRMTPDGGIPDDNPFPDSLVYSSGHRNVQGLGWAADGTMFASEFGQDTWDELNRIEPGQNYGWPVVEGIAGDTAFVDPVQQWAPADASPSGITVVDDVVYIANLRGELLRAVPVADPSRSAEHYASEYGRIRAVTPAPDGSLWILTGNTNSQGTAREGDDRILRVEPSALR